ncbi:hypothetical protein Sste5344_008774 [Sporothrix stenoceras]
MARALFRFVASSPRQTVRGGSMTTASGGILTKPSTPQIARLTTSTRPNSARTVTRLTTRHDRRAFQKDATAVPPPTRGANKVYKNADDAVADIPSGSVILSAGFGLSGVAETLIGALHRRGPESLHSLTAVSNNAGVEGKGGLAVLTEAGQIDRLVISYLGNNKGLEKKYLTGKIAVELCPQGTLAERIRAAGSGIPAFFTPTGAHSLLQEGEIPVRLNPDGGVAERGRVRETRVFDGRTFLMEPALPGDVAILRAHKVDRAGNCIFRYSTKAFGPLMGKAAKLTIVEAENIVELGEIDAGEVDLAGIYVDRIVPATVPSKIDILKTRERETEKNAPLDATKTPNPAVEKRLRIARRAAKELRPGFYVNLGVGIPTLAPSFLPVDEKVWIQSENGILGMGPYPLPEEVDPDIVNAGKETVTLVLGASTFDSSESFGMIRGGHVDVSILGALQVSATGDLANYMIPGKVFKGMGGAMDLVSNPDKTKIVVATEHVAKDGSSKIVQDCSLPLTGARVVSTIITDLCVFEVDRSGGSGLTLTELAPGVTADNRRADNTVDTSKLDRVLKIDVDKRTALVEPNVPMDALVAATVIKGLVPLVVMEFPGITVGGGFSGTSGESSLFRNGPFDATVNWIEIVLGNGKLVRASRMDGENTDLFWGAASAFGTLGVVTLLEAQLQEAKPYVRLSYTLQNTVHGSQNQIEDEIAKVQVAYVDGIMFFRKSTVVCSGVFADSVPQGEVTSQFSRAYDPWFYVHVRRMLKRLAKAPNKTITEYVPLVDYLFRYDRGGFWVAKYSFNYFLVPFNRVTRYLLNPFMHTRTMYRALHESGLADFYMVQDVGVPYKKVNEFVNWLDSTLEIFPLWLCPLLLARNSSDAEHGLHSGFARLSKDGPDGRLMNFGVWGPLKSGLSDYGSFVHANRLLEEKVHELGGKKWLYAHAYYTEDEFWAH